MKIESEKMTKSTIHPVDIHVGSRIRALREMQSRTQSWLGEKIGVSFQQLQKYEAGANRVCASRMFEIGAALGVPPSYFFEGLGDGTRRVDEIRTKEELKLLTDYRLVSKPVQRSICRTVAAIAKERADG